QELVKSNRVDVIQAVVAELIKIPDFAQRWKNRLNGVPENERDQYIFALAARWPDDVRGTPEHREKWHYINFPFKPAGTPNSVQVLAPDPDNILKAFKANWSLLRQGS